MNKGYKRSISIFICISVCINYTLYAEEKAPQSMSFFDKEDNSLDLSEYMSQAYGFLPIPILITEPAIGYGGGIALVYLHDKIGSKKSKLGKPIPPSVSALLFAKTENGTEAAGAAHIGYWLDDNLRTTTYIGKPNVFIDIYRESNAITMNLDGLFMYQSAKFRVAQSNLFLGLSYLYFGTDTSFNFENFERDFGGKSTIAAVGLIAEYDTRDNVFSPNKGMLLNLKSLFYDKALGSDYTLQTYKANGIFYNEISSKINLDFNVLGQMLEGEQNEVAPYLYPSISMRGVPMMKYQGENILSAQTQVSYAFTPRWKGLVFGGAGKAFGEQIAAPTLSFKEADTIYAGGIGFRYLIAKKFGLRVGIDIAKSNEDEAFYIQFGTAWSGF